jgi:hypothetical protein
LRVIQPFANPGNEGQPRKSGMRFHRRSPHLLRDKIILP